MISGLEKAGLVWDVVRVEPAHEAEGSRRDRLDGPAVLARTAPLRDELERTLPERPFSVELGRH